jgi:hypothetical protein
MSCGATTEYMGRTGSPAYLDKRINDPDRQINDQGNNRSGLRIVGTTN